MANHIKDFVKKPSFILSLILSIFLLKGIFLTAVFPIFSGQDEARHYNTVQYLSEPKEKNWEIKEFYSESKEKEKFETYNFSQEIRGTAGVIRNDTVQSVPYDYLSFDSGYNGKGEGEINLKKWMPYNEFSKPEVVSGSFYHNLVSVLEKFFSEQSILIRFFLIRISSVVLGVFAVWCSYFIAKNIGFSEKNSLILAAIISFQPRFSFYFTNINYDVMLIPAFFLFTLGGVLALKNGISWKNILIMLFAMALGLATKMTGIILLPIFFILMAVLIYRKAKSARINKKYFFAALIMVLIPTFLFFHKYDLEDIFGSYKSFKSLKIGEYLTESSGVGRVMLTSNSYWGNLSWEDNFISNNFIEIIWTLALFSLIGSVWFIFSKKKPDFLPEKKYIIFLLFVIFLLQIGIRFADLRIFSNIGTLELGAPGRYFLPNLVSHLILAFVGFGMLLRKREYFDKSLIIGFILMVSFCFFEIFNIIIPRYYL